MKKGLGPLLVVLLLAVGGWYVYTNVLGGSVSGPTNTPQVEAPDVGLDDVRDGAGDAADGAVEGAKEGSDFLAGLDPIIYRTVVPVMIFFAAVYWLWKDPKRRSLALLVIVVALIATIAGRSG